MPAVKTLAQEAEISEDALADEASHLADFFAAPKHIPGPTSDVESPNAVHQADLLFLPHDRLLKGKKVYKYALTVVDVLSRFKAAQPLISKDFSEVSKAFQTIYERGPLRWPKIVQFDPGWCHKRNGTASCEDKKRECKRSQGPGNHQVIQSNFGSIWAPLYLPIQ